MSLSEIVSPYIPYKQSMGRRLHTADRTLKSFGKAMGEVGIADVQPARGQVFLAGTGPIPRLWHRQQEALRGFYRLAMARSFVAVSPLPLNHRTLWCLTSSPLKNDGVCSIPPLLQLAPLVVPFSPIPAVC